MDFKNTNLAKGGDKNILYLKKKKYICSSMVSFSFEHDIVDKLWGFLPSSS